MSYEFQSDEPRLQLTKAAAADPRLISHLTGKPVDYSTMFRYAKTGALSMTGQRVFLPIEKHPSGYRTTKSAIDWFFDKLNERSVPAARTSRRDAHLKNVDAELAAAGLT